MIFGIVMGAVMILAGAFAPNPLIKLTLIPIGFYIVLMLLPRKRVIR